MRKSKHTTPKVSTKPSDTPLSKRTLNLVNHDDVSYPLAEEDHELLSDLKIPLTQIKLDELILLTAFCKRKKVKIEVVTFHDLEQAMFKKLESKWKHEFLGDTYVLKFVWPRQLKGSPPIKTDVMVQSITRWYARHFVRLEQTTKRTSKQHSLLLKKIRL